MIIQNKKTKQTFDITQEDWDKMKEMEVDRRYKVLDKSNVKPENKIPVDIVEHIKKYKEPLTGLNVADAVERMKEMTREELEAVEDERVTVQRAKEKLLNNGL